MPAEKGARLIVEAVLKEASDESAQIIAAAEGEAKALLDAERLAVKEESDLETKEARVRGKLVYEEVLAA